jgi:hypothetical protein
VPINTITGSTINLGLALLNDISTHGHGLTKFDRDTLLSRSVTIKLTDLNVL